MPKRTRGLWFYEYRWSRREGIHHSTYGRFFWFVGLKSNRKGWDSHA